MELEPIVQSTPKSEESKGDEEEGGNDTPGEDPDNGQMSIF
jgi:hypothetical protein